MHFTANHPCWREKVLVAHAPFFCKKTFARRRLQEGQLFISSVILQCVELGELLVDSGVSGALFSLV